VKIFLSGPDVLRLLDLDAVALERLIATRVLEVAGYTRRGRPLFEPSEVPRILKRLRDQCPE
jgi:hypothetical protein